VNEPRNTNTPLFITVLCACLGLLTVGALPAQGSVRQAATEVAQYGASSTRLRLAASAASTLQVLKIDDRWLPDSVAAGQPAEILYQTPEALTDKTEVLLIAHLPRAALSDSPCETAQAGLSRDEER
jgi:hypothetical protein